MTEQFSNLGQTTINQVGGIQATDTTVVVAALHGTNSGNTFPSSGNFRVLLGTDASSEITVCTAVNPLTNTFTIVRGQEGTIAKAWPNGTSVTISVTAQAIRQLQADVFSVGPFINRPAQGLPSGSIYYPSDGTLPFVWDPGAGQWRPQIKWGTLGYQPPAAATWTQQNSPITVADSAGGIWVTTSNFTATQKIAGIERTATPPYILTAFIIPGPYVTGVASATGHAGMYIRDSSNNLTVFGVDNNDGNPGSSILVTHWSGFNTNTHTDVSGSAAVIGTTGIWFRLQDDGTNHYFSYSNDGVNFIPVWQESRTAFLGASQPAYGMEVRGFNMSTSNNPNAITGATLYSWNVQNTNNFVLTTADLLRTTPQQPPQVSVSQSLPPGWIGPTLH